MKVNDGVSLSLRLPLPITSGSDNTQGPLETWTRRG